MCECDEDTKLLRSSSLFSVIKPYSKCFKVFVEFLGSVVVEGAQILESCSVAELILILGLHHCRPLRAQDSHCLGNVHDALILHAFQHNAQGNEDTCSTNTSTETNQANNWDLKSSLRLHWEYKTLNFSLLKIIKRVTDLQWTVMGPSCPNCSFVLCTCPMKSMKPSPDLGTPCSGQSTNWNCLIVLDWPSLASVTFNQAQYSHLRFIQK